MDSNQVSASFDFNTELNAGGDCSDSNSGHCKSGTTCESDVCKLNAGGDCSDPNSGHCKSGTTCESDVCKKLEGQECTGTGDAANCVNNADCRNSTCACNTGYSPSDGLCTS
ncbi:hypothetical protein BaRGS_00039766, partial [Batillaria attramentaria]